ncbi:MAG: ABC transporter permease [Planctomycetaceae bacterium]
MFQTFRTALELPLLKREMIELAQHKRTYVLRCLCLGVFALVFLVMYTSIRHRAMNVTWMLGQGREIVYAVFFTLLATIYALAPAMACAAITSEKEKQTLGLLLTSKLTPLGIVLEKIFSRMVPLLSLVIVSAPLFGVAYLFGGISFGETALGIVCLLYIVFQICVVAVFCSALVETSIAAFWLSYLILAAMYFALPILGGLTGFSRGGRTNLLGLHEVEFLFFPIYQMAMLGDRANTYPQYLLLTLPSLLLTLAFIPAATHALIRYGYGQATSFRIVLLKLQGQLSVTTARWLPQGRLKRQAEQAIIDADSPLSERISTDFPQTQPIVWREKRGTLLLRPRMQFLLIGGLFLVQTWVLAAAGAHDYEEVCAFFSFGIQILATLIVLSQASRLFARERERQTIDVLLVAPMSNRDILLNKVGGINLLILWLMIPILIAGLFNIALTNLRLSTLTAGTALTNETYYGHRNQLFGMDWLAAGFVYLTCLLGCAFINLHLSKWIALTVGLRLNTQIKGMIGSLVSILLLCLLPMILLALMMISVDADPDDFPLWFFSSPAIFVAVNEFHDLRMMYRSSILPESDVFLIGANFLIYGGLTLLLRSIVLHRLPTLLNRLDQPDAFPAGDFHSRK